MALTTKAYTKMDFFPSMHSNEEDIFYQEYGLLYAYREKKIGEKNFFGVCSL